MTLTELQAMTDAEINRLVAEQVMRWPLNDFGDWITSDGTCIEYDDWKPSTSRFDIAEMWVEIERRGLEEKFVSNLSAIANGRPTLHWFNTWKLIRASCHDQCIAALLSIKEPR